MVIYGYILPSEVSVPCEGNRKGRKDFEKAWLEVELPLAKGRRRDSKTYIFPPSPFKKF